MTKIRTRMYWVEEVADGNFRVYWDKFESPKYAIEWAMEYGKDLTKIVIVTGDLVKRFNPLTTFGVKNVQHY